MMKSMYSLVLLCCVLACNRPIKVADDFWGKEMKTHKRADSIRNEQAKVVQELVDAGIFASEAQAVHKESARILAIIAESDSMIKKVCFEGGEYRLNCHKEYMLGTNKDGQGYILNRLMNEYLVTINQLIKREVFADTVLNMKEIVKMVESMNLEKDPDHLDCVEYSYRSHFPYQPLTAFSLFRSRIMRIEKGAMDFLRKRHQEEQLFSAH